MAGIITGGIVLLLIIIVTLFLNLSPEFGSSPSKEEQKAFASSGHFEDGVFVNEIETSMDMDFGTIMSVFRDFFTKSGSIGPKGEIPSAEVDLSEAGSVTEVTWLGHSAFMLQMEGMNILLDPMLGPVAGPHPWLSPGRFRYDPAVAVEDLPHIDAVIISHDHFDHLDYGSIKKLTEKTDHFYMPLGVGSHFRSWDVPADRVHELNWGDDMTLGGLKFYCRTARHFSGRAIMDRNATMWGSWVIESATQRIYFSGDGGYGPHFKAIGEEFGSFDLALLECGQYDQRWIDIHMLPEQTAQAGIDLKAKLAMPIHWGAFTLGFHHWKDPVERVTKAADSLGLELTTPMIGEAIVLDGRAVPTEKWWEKVD